MYYLLLVVVIIELLVTNNKWISHDCDELDDLVTVFLSLLLFLRHKRVHREQHEPLSWKCSVCKHNRFLPMYVFTWVSR